MGSPVRNLTLIATLHSQTWFLQIALLYQWAVSLVEKTGGEYAERVSDLVPSILHPVQGSRLSRLLLTV